MKTNVLYFGDNLEILRKYIPDKSIDLIYLDPPFNSKKDYNILFKENGGVESEAQIKPLPIPGTGRRRQRTPTRRL